MVEEFQWNISVLQVYYNIESIYLKLYNNKRHDSLVKLMSPFVHMHTHIGCLHHCVKACVKPRDAVLCLCLRKVLCIKLLHGAIRFYAYAYGGLMPSIIHWVWYILHIRIWTKGGTTWATTIQPPPGDVVENYNFKWTVTMQAYFGIDFALKPNSW